LRKKAWKLAEEGKTNEAGVVAEQATAAYELAVALGRRARAQARADKARELGKKKMMELAALEADQARLEGEIEALELRARVQEDKQALGDEEKLTPERAQARRRAAFVLYREAQVLCTGARLIGAPEADYKPLLGELETLGTRLEQGSSERDIFPKASALRARCLKTLTDLRASRSLAEPESAENDIFLEEATALELPAQRDDRGIVVSLSQILAGTELSETTRAELRKAAKLALGHKNAPVVMVVHTSVAAENPKASAWGEAAKGIFAAEGAPPVEVVLAGHNSPLVARQSSGAAALNRRIEVVFVTPRL
jgi:hypothetical protein